MAKHLPAVMARGIREMVLSCNLFSLPPNILGQTPFSIFIFYVKYWQEIKLAYKSLKGKVFQDNADYMDVWNHMTQRGLNSQWFLFRKYLNIQNK